MTNSKFDLFQIKPIHHSINSAFQHFVIQPVSNSTNSIFDQLQICPVSNLTNIINFDKSQIRPTQHLNSYKFDQLKLKPFSITEVVVLGGRSGSVSAISSTEILDSRRGKWIPGGTLAKPKKRDFWTCTAKLYGSVITAVNQRASVLIKKNLLKYFGRNVLLTRPLKFHATGPSLRRMQHTFMNEHDNQRSC